MARPRKRERGQSILLAVVGLLVLAVGMYTSYNISRSVYEKIKLQNTADATAYSLASIEARTFNFVAFSNRAQVANYVQMMEAQSMLSNITFLEGYLGFHGDLFMTTGNLLKFWGRIFSYLEALGEMLYRFGDGLRMAHERVADLVDGWERAGTTRLFIQQRTLVNKALFGVGAMMALTTLAQLADGGQNIVRENDPKARLTWMSYLLNAVNAVSFGTAFDPASFGMLSGSKEQEEAKRIMAELSNASRFGGGTPDFIASRSIAQGLTTAVGSVRTQLEDAHRELEDVGGSRRRRRRARNARRIISRMLNLITFDSYVGTTKLVTADGGSTSAGDHVVDLEATAKSDPDFSGLAVGDAIIAKDMASAPFRGIFETGFANVISTEDESEHCRYYKPDGYGSEPSLRAHARWAQFVSLLASASQAEDLGFECRTEDEDDHTWPGGGIGPYLKFAPKKSGVSATRVSFNQPDVWVFLNKPPEDMALPLENDERFELRTPAGRAELDARIGEDGLLFDGINVMARAQVYYHRPGAWHEPPNFFNPYWGARLAPKGEAIHRLLNAPGLELGGTEVGRMITGFVADNIWMH